jgi:hypothetical protein
MFARGSRFIIAPSSPAGSYHPSSCSCSEAGGFQAGSATGMAATGCEPCANGYYSDTLGPRGCQPCPNNTYSTMTLDFRDFLKCPNSTSPRLYFPFVASSGSSDECFSVSVGATSCVSCPADKPYTLGPASPSKSSCRACPPEHYLDLPTKTCKKCSSACGRGFYQTSDCSETMPRFLTLSALNPNCFYYTSKPKPK